MPLREDPYYAAEVLYRSRFSLILIRPAEEHRLGALSRWLGRQPASAVLCQFEAVSDECRKDFILGPSVAIESHVFDERRSRIPIKRLARHIKRTGASALAVLVPVSERTLDRSLELYEDLTSLGIPCCLNLRGGLARVGQVLRSGKAGRSLTCLRGVPTPALLGEILEDAHCGTLGPIYPSTLSRLNGNTSTPKQGLLATVCSGPELKGV
ncbi:hypothetical protein PUV47_02250 [Pseudovibrio exalbescens]|uniref:hypothetical protein n=1 Tax=Pseudovibrio exalbescens TaxID=197461 RepID=UPI002366008B|nr:hypothetical protein [Pseudovibrio exalbescens]MDD7908726.1 hypothetical protein [Pseudovibrio exalbescens]